MHFHVWCLLFACYQSGALQLCLPNLSVVCCICFTYLPDAFCHSLFSFDFVMAILWGPSRLKGFIQFTESMMCSASIFLFPLMNLKLKESENDERFLLIKHIAYMSVYFLNLWMQYIKRTALREYNASSAEVLCEVYILRHKFSLASWAAFYFWQVIFHFSTKTIFLCSFGLMCHNSTNSTRKRRLMWQWICGDSSQKKSRAKTTE